MESQSSDEEDQLFDALDDFPFYDCLTCDQSEPSTSHLPSTLCRRTFSRREITGKEPIESLPEASTLEDHSRTRSSSREPRYNIFFDLKPNESILAVTESSRDGVSSIRVSEENNSVESTITIAENVESVDQARNNCADSSAEFSESLNSNSSLLMFIVGFVIKAIGEVLMRYLVEKPLEIKEMLNFDCTKTSPVAFVPIVSCAAIGCDSKCREKIDVWKNVGPRVISMDHKLKVTVSLTLPESEYNKKLGMFQVRVDFLSVNGETLASASHPCMLKFRSEPICLLLTFFKVAPLITSYTSEAQTLNSKIRGLNEGIVPTDCLRVVLEQ
ncbi:NOD26-like intrinsic protein 1,2 isoform 1 [Hibiscus syriacus]|uniref:NOD26-like intrinsic protein 1,2 isoform 1 n=1 Tax=Hibiscus syriacus TaxID=106335 RepID=A0A6A3BVG3_HIBSY|nr:NOD26-like intrinsic protein 1,2 isoform 1 [Hibiscus syriacus]